MARITDQELSAGLVRDINRLRAENEKLTDALLSIDESQLTREQIQQSLDALGIDTTAAQDKLRSMLAARAIKENPDG